MLVLSLHLQAKEDEVPLDGEKPEQPIEGKGGESVSRTQNLLQGVDLASPSQASPATEAIRSDWAPQVAELSGEVKS